MIPMELFPNGAVPSRDRANEPIIAIVKTSNEEGYANDGESHSNNEVGHFEFREGLGVGEFDQHHRHGQDHRVDRVFHSPWPFLLAP